MNIVLLLIQSAEYHQVFTFLLTSELRSDWLKCDIVETRKLCYQCFLSHDNFTPNVLYSILISSHNHTRGNRSRHDLVLDFTTDAKIGISQSFEKHGAIGSFAGNPLATH